MSDKDAAARKLELLKQFRDGMIKRHFGIYIDSEPIIDVGLKQADAAASALKAEDLGGYGALEPLMDDPEPGVRAGAADYVMYVMPEKARPVLEALASSAELEAGATARLALWAHENEKTLN
jgi:hypothetical protein